MMVAGCRARDSVSPPPGALTPAPAMAAPTPDAPAPAEEAAAEAAAVGAPETPAAADAWVAEAVDEGLWAEIMPGTSAEPDPARAAQLRAFFVAHPRYRSADLRAELWDHACGLGGVEAAHQHLLEPPEQTPLVVDVSGDSWGVFVAHSSGYCTSDDWGYYAGEALEKAAAPQTAPDNAPLDIIQEKIACVFHCDDPLLLAAQIRHVCFTFYLL